MSGIYILKTKDGYRVNFSKKYDCLFGSFNDDTMNYNIDALTLKQIFGNCRVIPIEPFAFEAAKGISRVHQDTDDGIMLIKEYQNFTFEDLLNGKANKTE
jgi:hypothetical protein